MVMLFKREQLKKFKIALLTFCFGIQLVEAQVKAPQLTPLTPNAAALWKYSEIPVSMYSGIPSINIPIYEIKSGSLKVPISLSYHAGGIRYEDQASWVGLGWTLQAGGTVTRNVKGKPDEKTGGILTFSNTMPTNIAPCDNDFFESVTYNGYPGWRDVQPDEFSYSFPGKTGRFIFQQGVAQPVTIPYDPILVQYGAELSSFQITDESGNKHSFNTKEITDGGLTPNFLESMVSSTWYLNEINSPDDTKKVIFTYTDGEAAYQKHTRSYGITVIDQVWGIAESGGCSLPTPVIGNALQNNMSYYTQVKNLSEIAFDEGKIEFIQSTNYRTDIYDKQRSLEYIKIYAKSGSGYELKKTIKMVYSYFKKNAGNTLADWRLKLDKIQVLNSTGEISEEYGFDYHTTTFSGDINDNNDFCAQDYFGYYNGKTTNTNLIPQQTITYTPYGYANQVQIGGADRSTMPTYLTEGVLKKINYPTGGYTEFEFESHQYLNQSQVAYAGGLRVKKIKSTTSATDPNPIIKKYMYGQNGSGNGQPNFSNYIGYYVNTHDVTCIENDMYNGLISNMGYLVRTYNSSSSLQVDAYDGTSVVYPYVSEYIEDQLGFNNGRIDYEFDNGSYTADNIYVIYSATSNGYQRQSNHWKRGFLTKKTIFTADNKKVSATTTNYTELKSYNQIVGMLVSQPHYFTRQQPLDCYTGAGVPRFSYNYYPVKSGILKPSTETEYIYDPVVQTEALSKTASYTYDENSLLPIQTEQVVEQGTNFETKVIKKIKYPFQYTFSGTPSGSDALGIKYLQDKNILSTPIEQYNIKQLSSNGSIISSTITSGIINEFISGKTNPNKVWSLKTIPAISESSFGTGSTISGNTFSKNAAYEPRLTVSYDANGNVKEHYMESNMYNSYLWDYNQNYVVAEVKNAAQSQIAYTSFETDAMGSWDYMPDAIHNNTAPTGNKVYNLASGVIGRYGLNASTTYIVSYWSNKTTAYTIPGTIAGYPVIGNNINGWRYFEHRVTGQSFVNISGNGLIDELRLYPVNAQMNTYTHEPLTGVKTQCDFNNKILYYEYDGFGRLILIRDQNRNILKKICYNYSGQPENCNVYYNAAVSLSVTKNDCGSGLIGSTITYTIPANMYTGSTQAEADARALAAATASGQAYANANGTCTPLSGCANCSGIDKKCVYDVCETGYKVYTASVYNSATGQWECTYHYEWSDGSWSPDYIQYGSRPCTIQ